MWIVVEVMGVKKAIKASNVSDELFKYFCNIDVYVNHYKTISSKMEVLKVHTCKLDKDNRCLVCDSKFCIMPTMEIKNE